MNIAPTVCELWIDGPQKVWGVLCRIRGSEQTGRKAYCASTPELAIELAKRDGLEVKENANVEAG